MLELGLLAFMMRDNDDVPSSYRSLSTIFIVWVLVEYQLANSNRQLAVLFGRGTVIQKRIGLQGVYVLLR